MICSSRTFASVLALLAATVGPDCVVSVWPLSLLALMVRILGGSVGVLVVT
ncbi:hypothetical protein JYU19_01950 [bacterium AH-315-J21]|nr:hypothetical protein [bacterium AH-315-J21]